MVWFAWCKDLEKCFFFKNESYIESDYVGRTECSQLFDHICIYLLFLNLIYNNMFYPLLILITVLYSLLWEPHFPSGITSYPGTETSCPKQNTNVHVHQTAAQPLASPGMLWMVMARIRSMIRLQLLPLRTISSCSCLLSASWASGPWKLPLLLWCTSPFSILSECRIHRTADV